MPTVGVLNFSLGTVDAAGRVPITVTASIDFLNNDANNVYDLTLELWGDDRAFNGSDDRLLIIHTEKLIAQSGAPHAFSFSGSVRASRLNEDRNGRDEIYAKMILEPVAKYVRANSRIITARF